MSPMPRTTTIALSTALAAGGLLLASLAVPALAQTPGSTPTGWMGGMMGGGGASMHGQLPPEQLQQMQQWHAQRSGGPGMMGGQTPAQMHAQLPEDLRQQMDAMHAQMPASLQQQMQGPNGCHGGTSSEASADTAI